MNPYNKLFEERIIFLGVQIDDASANDVMAQLLDAGVHRPRPRHHHVHQLAGRVDDVDDGDLRHDAVRPAGDPDLLHRPGRLGGGGAAGRRDQGQADGAAQRPDPASTSRPPRAATASPATWRSRPARSCGCGPPWRSSWPRHTGQDEEQVRRDIERDKFLTAEEAKEYGIIDEVLTMHQEGQRACVEVVSSLSGRIQLFPLGPLKGFDGVHRDRSRRYRRYDKCLTASRDMSARGGHHGRHGGTM